MRFLNVMSIDKVRMNFEEFMMKNVKLVDTPKALGLKITSDIYSEINVPNFNKSSVDGYAILHENSNGASETSPTMLKCKEGFLIGEENSFELENGYCQYVVTGGMVPAGCSAVVKIEDTDKFNDQILIKKMVGKNTSIIKIGEEISKGQLVIKQGTVLTSRDIALLLSLGIKEVEVYKPLTCIVVSSGDELVRYNEEIKIGQTYDVNTYLITSELAKIGIEVKNTFLIKDDYELYLNTLKSNDVDIYITSGGSSKGESDYTLDVFEELTGNVLCHGINTKPGKPTILAQSSDKLYLGLPGNPVSAFLVLHQIISSMNKTNKINMKLSENVNSDHGKVTCMLVKADKNMCIPVHYRSSYLNCLSEAIGYFIIDENTEGKLKGDMVEVHLFE